jgi:LAO/AO transport system kinase
MIAPMPDAILRGDIASLSRAITLVESSRPDHRNAALSLLKALGPERSGALRLGVSGPPGAGKSTLIDRFGHWLCEQDMRVAVLAIDPSSTRHHGSILGDKTRMEHLSSQPRAYIRPSPSRGELGGVARATRESILLCEAAGFDIIIVETVGVGQSETLVADLVDCCLVLIPPGGGDDLQGIKKGLIEIADLIVVTKTDGDLADAAARAARDLRAALAILGVKDEGWRVPVLPVSAHEGLGFDTLWATINQHGAWSERSGVRTTRRASQRLLAFERMLHTRMIELLKANRHFAASYETARHRIETGQTSPGEASEQLALAIEATLKGG